MGTALVHAQRVGRAPQVLQPRGQAVALTLELAEVGQARRERRRGGTSLLTAGRLQEREAAGDGGGQLALEAGDLPLQRRARGPLGVCTDPSRPLEKLLLALHPAMPPSDHAIRLNTGFYMAPRRI